MDNKNPDGFSKNPDGFSEDSLRNLNYKLIELYEIIDEMNIKINSYLNIIKTQESYINYLESILNKNKIVI